MYICIMYAFIFVCTYYVLYSYLCLPTFIQILHFSNDFPTLPFLKVICFFIIKVTCAHYRISSVMDYTNLLSFPSTFLRL